MMAGCRAWLLAAAVNAGASMRLDAQVVAARAGDDLAGLWGAEVLLGPQMRGEVILGRRGTRWTARIAGFEASAQQTGDSVVIAFPGEQGSLRFWTSRPIAHGFWVQPGGNMSPYATPVAFSTAGPDAWRGTVNPIDDRFSLYVSIQRQGNGSLRGVFRNPEVNWTGNGRWFTVVHEGENAVFIDSATGKKRWVQPYDSSQRTMSFDFGGPIVLRPRSAEQVVGFTPRSPAAAPYEYRQPAERNDGWRTANAALVGLDEAVLQSVVRDIVSTSPLDNSAPRIHSLLVTRRGRLVLDEYFFGYSVDRPHDLRSASKTMTSVMAGVAMHRGAKFDMSTRLPQTPITVGQLLTHTSGKACDDNDEQSPGNEDTMQSQQAEQDWYRYFLSLPKAHEPGTTYAYCSAGINSVGRVISASLGLWLPAFFDRYVAQPLQITRYGVNLMPSGDAYSGGGMHMLPRDLLKFGQLYLDGGVWNGQRLVSKEWVTRSTSPQQDVPDGSHDGFAWHLHDLRVGAKSYATYEASGNGGQFLLVVPELELAIVATAGNYGQYGAWRKIREQVVPHVMAAVSPP